MLTLRDSDRVSNASGDTRPHAVVIGSGFGGLAAAVRLGARGYRVTVLEKRTTIGGRAAVFRQDGFTFDAGPTIVTAPYLFEDLWRLKNRRLEDDVELKPLSPFFRIRFHDGRVFRYSGDPDAMRAEVARFSPADVAGYEKFMQVSKEICRIGFEQLGHVPFGSISTMAKIAPDLLRLKGYRTVYGLVSRYIKDPGLRTVFSFHPLLIGGNPFTTTAVYCLIAHLEREWGVHYAMGGTGRLVEGLADLITESGDVVRTGADVRSIMVENNAATGVELASGERIPADIVVSNADSAWTYQKLLPPDVRHRWTNRKLASARYSMSLFVWYFGTRRRYEDVGHHTILLGPRYRQLLTDIFRRKVLADDFSLYLHRPTATDPAMAPPGCDAFYVLSPVPNLDSGTDWQTRAESYRRSIARHLEQTLLPDLENQIVTSRIMTPDHFLGELNSVKGAAFGLEPVFTQSAWFRPHNRSEEIDRLYLVGAGTHPGAGMPGVLSSARILDRVVPNAAVLTH